MQTVQQQNNSTFSSDSFPQQSEQLKKTLKLSKNLKLNYWTIQEQTIYLNFLKQHMPMITSTQYRKKQRIFKKISSLLGTRTPIQVKSHHQKLEDKYKNISKIIAYLQKWLRSNGQEGYSQQTFSVDSSPEVLMKDANIQTDYLVVEPFFQIDYPQNRISVTFIMEEDSLFI